MRVLVDIGHPAHVHLFKNLAWRLRKNRHEILFTCRESEYETRLLEIYNFKYYSFGRKFRSRPGKIAGLVKFDLQEIGRALIFKPDLFISHGSMYAAHAASVINRPHISLEDSGNMEQIRLYLPFTRCVLTPDVLAEDLGPKQIRYRGYHELAYLHPNVFTPDSEVWKILGIDRETPYTIIRFSSWRATHDYGRSGFTLSEKENLLKELSLRMKVFISAEGEIPEQFTNLKLATPPELLHSVITNAKLVISEGATIASEAGVLGTPSIYVNPIVRMYNEDQEKYGLVSNFRSGSRVLEKALELLETERLKDEWQIRRNKMLKDKIDVSSFLVWFVENYPESLWSMKENPDYQMRFN